MRVQFFSDDDNDGDKRFLVPWRWLFLFPVCVWLTTHDKFVLIYSEMFGTSCTERNSDIL